MKRMLYANDVLKHFTPYGLPGCWSKPTGFPVINFQFFKDWCGPVISTGLVELLPEDFPVYKIGKLTPGIYIRQPLGAHKPDIALRVFGQVVKIKKVSSHNRITDNR
ncbi:hypothetical protein [Desulfoscipio gibsoniae]|uniref:Uncharacterized protein n=1 Tax=Desulfoscipio gibsoniae DSM 7213 TaxID=767817 RepID=R4KLW9_9FIRM|nr:hypothetical protein [Desulfoscipio gibsoniae]AGL02537.1 hypothetical protein Desgi_3182 [Desulfoscipio gibsoniae DSM 7213]